MAHEEDGWSENKQYPAGEQYNPKPRPGELRDEKDTVRQVEQTERMISSGTWRSWASGHNGSVVPKELTHEKDYIRREDDPSI